jgi:hypothetical protein
LDFGRRRRRFFWFVTSLPHQKATKCHRPSVVCSEEYVRHPLVVVLSALYVLFILLPAHRRTGRFLKIRSPLSLSLSSSFLLFVRPKTTKTPRRI